MVLAFPLDIFPYKLHLLISKMLDLLKISLYGNAFTCQLQSLKLVMLQVWQKWD